MSNEVSAAKIRSNPKFHELVRQRDSLAWLLTAVVLVMYFGFTLLVAFAPDFLTQPMGAGTVIPVGMPIGVAVIFCSCLLTGIYVYRANTEFDRLTQEIMREATK